MSEQQYRSTLNRTFMVFNDIRDSFTKEHLNILTVEGSNLGQSMDQITRELISHPSIEGIIMWAAISPTGCAVMCLTGQNFKNLPIGDAIDRIRQELTYEGLTGVTDAGGFFKASLFHGEYDFHFRYPDAVNNSSSYIRGFKVALKKTEGNNKIVSIMLHAIILLLL